MSPLFQSIARASAPYMKGDLTYWVESGWWLTLGHITISLCSLALYIVFAHTLPKDVYGQYQYLLSVGAIIGAFTLTGMNSAVARAVARGHEGSLRQAVVLQLWWAILPFLGALAIGVYYFTQGNILLAAGFGLLAVFTPVNNAFNTYAAYLQGKKVFRESYFFGLGWNLPYYAAMVLAAYFTPYALALLAVNVLTQGAGLALTYWRVLRAFKPNRATDPELESYGKHLSAMNLFTAVVAQIDTVLAFHFLGAVPLAIYSFATAIPERAAGFLKFIPAAALPKFAENDDYRLPLMGRKMGIALMSALIITLLYIALAPILFRLLFPAYMEAVPYSMAYAFITIASLGSVYTTVLTARKDVRGLYWFNAGSALAQFALQLAGVIFYGLWGLIIAKLLSGFVSFFLAALFAREKPH